MHRRYELLASLEAARDFAMTSTDTAAASERLRQALKAWRDYEALMDVVRQANGTIEHARKATA